MYGRLEQPQLGYQAVDQLAAWEEIARGWLVSHDAQHNDALRRDRTYRCVECGKGVALALDSKGATYQYTQEQWLALVVLHLRNHHGDLDPDKG